MTFRIRHQKRYSRREHFFRMFALLYVGVPHVIALIIPTLRVWYYVGSMRMQIEKTGSVPQQWFDYIIQWKNWFVRVRAYLGFLTDERPKIGIWAQQSESVYRTTYPAGIDFDEASYRHGIGFFEIVPNIIYVALRTPLVFLYQFAAWWSIWHTGTFPRHMHAYIVRTMKMGAAYYAWAQLLEERKPGLTANRS